MKEKDLKNSNHPRSNLMKESFHGLATFQLQLYLFNAQEKSERNIPLFQGKKQLYLYDVKKTYRFNIPREK